MKSLLVIILIILLIIGRFGFDLAMNAQAKSVSSGDTEAAIENMTTKVFAFTNVVAGSWIAVGLILGYLIYRFTLGKKVISNTSFPKYIFLSIIPSLAFFIILLVKPPHVVATMLAEAFGSLMVFVLAFTGLVFGFALHAVTSILAD